jgi:plastocyanin
VGTPVIVTNEDDVSHTWTSEDDVFDSGSLSQGESFQYTFEDAGEYSFVCTIHPGMSGSISVEG